MERIQKALYKATSPYSYHSDELAVIKDVVIVTPKGKLPRPCFLLEYENGDMDYAPIDDIYITTN